MIRKSKTNNKRRCLLVDRFLWTLFLTVFLLPAATAQVAFKEEKTKVNSIKRDRQYLYGEGIAETEEEARTTAEQNLRQAVLQFISEEKELLEAEAVIVNAARQNTSQIKLKRGTLERVFLYVHKKNIIPSDNSFVIEQSETPAVAEEATAVEKAAEAIVEAEAVTVPPAEIVERMEEPETNLAETKVEVEAETESDKEAAPAATTLDRILACPDMAALQQCLATEKAAHRVMWGELKQDFKPNWLLVAYEGNMIRAIFDKGLQRRTNLLTGQAEDVADYAGCSKLWFIIYD